MQNLSFLIPVAILVFLIGMVIWVALAQRQRAQVKRLQVARLGFTPLEKAARDVLLRLADLRPFSTRQIPTVRNLYTRRLPTGNLYLFDLETSSGGQSTFLGENLILVVSSTLNLPRFAVFPRLVSGTGTAGALQDRLIQQLASRTGLVVAPVSQPRRFSEHYTLWAESQAAANELIDSGLLDPLAAVKDQHIQARGDAFAYSSTRFKRSDRSPEEELVNLVDQAQRVLHVLENFRARPVINRF